MEIAEAPRRGRPRSVDSETIDVLMLRGYVPSAAEPESFEPDGTPATFKKHRKGEVVGLSPDEAKALMRRGIAVRPDEATQAHLIQAGLIKPEPVDEDAN